MARIDTDDVKGSAGMTKKTAKWFELSGRPQIRRYQVEGREWISALSCATQRKDEAVEFESLCLVAPQELHQDDEETEALGRSRQRVTSARRTEERRWNAAHRTTTGHTSRTPRQGAYGEAWYQRRPASASAGAGAERPHVDEACLLREKALRIPLSELQVTTGKKPSPARCGALLFRSAWAAIEDKRPAGAAHSPSASTTDRKGAAKALGLWQGFSATS